MTKYESKKHKQDFINFLFYHYFDGDMKRFISVTDYSEVQMRNWLSGQRSPRKATLDYILHCRFSPDFQIVCEFKEIDGDKPTMTQLRKFLGAHSEEPGIYAFYDARAQLLYIGKATKLRLEIYAALLGRVDHVILPSGIRNRKKTRWELVTYFSAYSIPSASHRDHPKHVESLILRVSKPPLNKQIGRLTKVSKPK
jgi:hypothetical protein